MRHRIHKTRLTGFLIVGLLTAASPAGAQLSPTPVAVRLGQRALDPEIVPDPYGVNHTWTSRDKYYHFGVSAVGAAAVYSGARWLGLKRWPSVGVAVGLVGVAGLVREWDDRGRPGKYFSEKDLIWNAAGITLGVGIPDLFFRRHDAEPPGG